jgi:photosystem II stability/assembly factor-like uncharacterized protein
MKYFLISFVLLQICLYPQWSQEYPSPSGKNILSISNSPSGDFYFAGFVNVLKTTDYGQSWNVQKEIAGINDLWFSTFFIDDLTGWISGISLIYKTTDGGNSWIEQNSNTTDQINDIQFINSQTGFAVTGQEKKVLITTNGGELWIVKSVPSINFLECGFFVNETTGWVSGQNEIFKTTDKGNTWLKTNIVSLFKSAFFVDENVGWFVGGNGRIIKTSDGGTSWLDQASNTSAFLTSIFMMNENIGWAAGFEGTILKTVDGGQNWDTQSNTTTKNLYVINFIDQYNGFAAGEEGIILKTTDGGENWIEISKTLSADLNKTFFINSQSGWIACDEGKVLMTTDAGENWVLQNTPTSNSLRDIYFINSDLGWAAGTAGSILHTTNGGTNWFSQNSGITSIINSIHFADSLTGFSVGVGGRILKTTDGGINWNNISISNSAYLSKIACVTEAEAWIAGFDNSEYKSLLLRTTDGGTSWGHLLSVDSLALYGLSIKDFSVITGGGKLTTNGTDMRIYRTDNNGAFWNLIYSDLNTNVYNYIWDMKISPMNNISAISKNKYLFSSDNGINWQVQSFAGEEISSINYSDNSVGWISGKNSLLLKNINGGVTQFNFYEIDIPADYSLSQNYPNPFNPVTKINYSLALSGKAIMKIYDVLGREIRTLVNEYKQAGNHTVEFNAAGLASGVYIYQLRADEYLKAKKMLLVK